MLPMSGNARRAFWELLKLSVGNSQNESGKAELVSQLLLRAATPDGMDVSTSFSISSATILVTFEKSL